MPSCFRDAGTGIWEQSQPPSAFYFLPGALFRGSALSVLPCWYLLLVFLGVLPLPLSLWSLLYNSRGAGRRPARAQWPLALPLSLGSLVGFVLRVSPPKLLPPCLPAPVPALALKTVCAAAAATASLFLQAPPLAAWQPRSSFPAHLRGSLCPLSPSLNLPLQELACKFIMAPW